MRIKFRAPHAIDALLDGVEVHEGNLTHWLIFTQVVPAGVPAARPAALGNAASFPTEGGDKCQG